MNRPNKKKARKPQQSAVKIQPMVAPPVGPNDTFEPGPILLAYCHPGQVDGNFHNSVVNVAVADCMTKRLIGSYMAIESGPRIATTRNTMCRNMLNEHPWAKYLLMVDTDMSFTYQDVLRLYEAMETHDLGVCGGLCFSVGQEDGMKSTMLIMPEFDEANPPTEVVSLQPYEKLHGTIPENTVLEVFATGAAFLMIRRDVLEKIRAVGGEDEKDAVHKPWLWFSEAAVGDGELGEDVAFCVRARQQGFSTFVHTGIDIPHRKRMMFGLQTWRGANAIAETQVADVSAVG